MTPHLLSLCTTAAIASLALSVAGCATRPAVPYEPGPLRHVAGPAGTLYIDDGGSGGLPVVFVHSYAGNVSHWKDSLAALRKTRRAVALDLRGHGRSQPVLSNDFAIASLAKDIGAVADRLMLERFVIVGHSLGGSAAVEYAGSNPGRVAGLVLVATPGKPPAELAQKMMAGMRADYDRMNREIWTRLMKDARPEVRLKLTNEMGSVPREASLAIFEASFAHDAVAALRRYPGPKLSITAGEEQPFDLHKLDRTLPHRHIAGTSHWPHLDTPEAFNTLLDEFLAQLR